MLEDIILEDEVFEGEPELILTVAEAPSRDIAEQCRSGGQRSGGQVVDRFERGSESEVKATSVSYLVGARRFPKDPSISYMQQHRSIH